MVVEPRQSQDGGGAQWCRSVFRPAPDGLELHMSDGAEKDVHSFMLELVEGLDDGNLPAAQLVVLERVKQAAVEGGFQIRGKASVILISDDGGCGRDDQV